MHMHDMQGGAVPLVEALKYGQEAASGLLLGLRDANGRVLVDIDEPDGFGASRNLSDESVAKTKV